MVENTEIVNLINIGILLGKHGMPRKELETIADIEKHIFDTFGIYVYKNQLISDILQNIKNQV